MVTIPISAAFIGAALIRGEALIFMWIPKGAAFIRGRCLFEAWRLLEEIWYLLVINKLNVINFLLINYQNIAAIMKKFVILS